MGVSANPMSCRARNPRKLRPIRCHWRRTAILLCVALAAFSACRTAAQEKLPDWQVQVRKYAEAKDWDAAMCVVNQQINRYPQDMDIRAWRARLLTWSGRIAEAEKEYLEILKVARTDPDNWIGLAGVYMREGKMEDALRAADTAVELDPKRSDLHASRARVLRAAGIPKEARQEFQRALNLDPTSSEARAGLAPAEGEFKHELRFGQDDDLFNFESPYNDEWVSLVSQWNSHWATSVAGSFFQRIGVDSGKFDASVTGKLPKWGALTVGGATAHDNAVIPKSEAYFNLDHGLRISEKGFVRAFELVYGQHWYWYQTSRILALNGTIVTYLPRAWTFTAGATGARSGFSGTAVEWRPSGLARLDFPLAHSAERRLSGNIFFAAGTEDFAEIDQLGAFASQTYGGGLRFWINAQQDVTAYAGYQKRTGGHIDDSFGFSYGIHF